MFQEFDLAWDCVGKGYSLSWYDEQGKDGVKVPEFRACKRASFDVEVKAIDLDTGSPIKHMHASLLTESVMKGIQVDKQLMGTLSLTFVASPPKSDGGRKAIVDQIISLIAPGEINIQLEEVKIQGKLQKVDNKPTSFTKIKQSLKDEYPDAYPPYTLCGVKRIGEGKVANALTCMFFSHKEHALDKAVKKVLRSCSEKFDGEVPGIARVYLPHVDETFLGGALDAFTKQIVNWLKENEERGAKFAAIQFVSHYSIRHYVTNIEIFCAERNLINPAFSEFEGLEVLQ